MFAALRMLLDTVPCKDFFGLCFGPLRMLSWPTNFKGSIIKEALVVFRCIEKQDSALGLPIRTPRPALASLSVRSLVHWV